MAHLKLKNDTKRKAHTLDTVSKELKESPSSVGKVLELRGKSKALPYQAARMEILLRSFRQTVVAANLAGAGRGAMALPEHRATYPR